METKRFTPLFTLLAGCMLLAGASINIQAQGVISYGLIIAGTAVTSENYNQITGPGISGGVKYDNNTRTLTLTNATINTDYHGISCQMKDLTIQLEGVNSITTSGDYKAGIFMESHTNLANLGELYIKGKVKGQGKLVIKVINSKGEEGITTYQPTTIENCELDISCATGRPIFGGRLANNPAYYLRFKNSRVKLSTSGPGSSSVIYGFNSVYYEGCSIISPPEAELTYDVIYGYRQNGEPVKEMEISYQLFQLWINGVQAHIHNASDILGDGGSVKYERFTKTLTLKNANINTDNEGIKSEEENLIIELIGENNVTSFTKTAIYLGKNTTIQGNATASLSVLAASIAPTALYCDSSTLTITGGCSVQAVSRSTTAVGGNQAFLKINGSKLAAEGAGSQGTIRNYKNIELIDAAFTLPLNAEFNPTVQGVANADGVLIKDWIYIEPKTGTHLYNVILDNAGTNTTAVINAVCDFLGLDSEGAQNLVNSAPVILVKGYNKEKAQEFETALEKAGATVLLSSYVSDDAYPLWVGGLQATKFNTSKIISKGISGEVSYNNDTQTLTLDNATITGFLEKEYGSGNNYLYCINTDLDVLKINLIGANTISLNLNTSFGGNSSYFGHGINNNNQDIMLVGNGSLKIDVSIVGNGNTKTAHSYGIEAYKGKITISKNVSLEVATQATGATGTYGSALICDTETYPNIENETQRVIKEGNDAASALQVDNLTMRDNTDTNCSKPYVKISNIDTGLSTLAAEGIYVWGEKGVISIETPYPLKGESGAKIAHIYNVSGMLVRTLSLQGTEGQVAVPAGIYIVKIGTAIEKVVVR